MEELGLPTVHKNSKTSDPLLAPPYPERGRGSRPSTSANPHSAGLWPLQESKSGIGYLGDERKGEGLMLSGSEGTDCILSCLLWGTRIVIPVKQQQKLLDDLHRDHPRITKMKAVSRSYFWWPGLDSSIETLAKSCQECQAVKNTPPVAPLHVVN